MDEFRIGSLGFGDSPFGQTKEGSKKRSKQNHVEPQEEPEDQVMLSSPGDTAEPPLGYLPGSPGEETK
jgi:hypothetical protein